MFWFLEGSSFDPVCSVVTVARYAEVDWTGLDLLHTWFRHRWETGDEFDLLKDHKAVLRQCPLDGDVPLTRRALPASAAGFAVDRLLSMGEARARISGSHGALGLASGAMGSSSCDNELTPYPDDDMETVGTFSNVPVDSHLDVCASLCRDFDAISLLYSSANVSVLEEPSDVFSLALQSPNAIAGCDAAVAAKAVALERVCLVEETVAASLAGWDLAKIDMVLGSNEARHAVERINTDLMAARQQISGQTTLQSELCDDQDASFQFEAW